MNSQIQKIPFVATAPAPSVAELLEKKSFCDGVGTLNYRIYTPQNMSADKKYPLILFFHGAGERGDDNERQLINGIGQFFADPLSPVYDCIVIAPQCPADDYWVSVPAWQLPKYSTDAIPESKPLCLVRKLIEESKSNLPIDADRIYATGLSMGAYATWDLLIRHSDLFAAAIPVCGGGDYDHADRITDVPIQTFHGDCDPIVLPSNTEQLVNTLLALGSKKIACTYYIGGNHNVWETAFATKGLFDWLLSHRRSDRP